MSITITSLSVLLTTWLSNKTLTSSTPIGPRIWTLLPHPMALSLLLVCHPNLTLFIYIWFVVGNLIYIYTLFYFSLVSDFWYSLLHLSPNLKDVNVDNHPQSNICANVSVVSSFVRVCSFHQRYRGKMFFKNGQIPNLDMAKRYWKSEQQAKQVRAWTYCPLKENY